MNARPLSADQLAALAALMATPAIKAKASITLSRNLLQVIDSLAGTPMPVQYRYIATIAWGHDFFNPDSAHIRRHS